MGAPDPRRSDWIHDRDVDVCIAHFTRSCEAFERAHARRHLCLARDDRALRRARALDGGDVDLAERDAEAAVGIVVVPELRSASHALRARVWLARGRVGDALAEATLAAHRGAVP